MAIALKRDAVAMTNDSADKDPIPLADCGGIGRYRERKCLRRLKISQASHEEASKS